jgi:precorrin-6B methylase 2
MRLCYLPVAYSPSWRWLACFLVVFQISGCAVKNYGDEQYKLRRAATGKDVMWIPTNIEMAHSMLSIAKVGAHDIVYDLGSGDGVIPIEAARKFGARAVGIEYNRDLVELSNRNAKRARVDHLVQFKKADLFTADFSDATVVTLYLGEALNLKLMPRVLSLSPGTRVVSNTFRMDTWTPDQQIRLASGEQAYLWIVPASIEGSWTLTGSSRFRNATLRIRQRQQLFDGNIESVGQRKIPLDSGRIDGYQVRFQVMDTSQTLNFVGATIKDTIVGYFEDFPQEKITIQKTN